MRIDNCRSCGGSRLDVILAFEPTPIADALLNAEDLAAPEIRIPLTLVFCRNCALVQILETVPPEVLFCRNYPYFSSVSPALMAHFRRSAETLMSNRKLGSTSLVLEIASNDGYMLRNFVERGIPVLGIDPAQGPAARAGEAGINTMCTFFTQGLASELRADGRRADVVLANNVLAHVPDLNGFVAGIGLILRDDGVAVIEVPYLIDMLAQGEFDTIYHQHLSYFSITALVPLFARHGLSLNHVERTSIHGGSLRVFVEHHSAPDDSVRNAIFQEAILRVDSTPLYYEFAQRVERTKATVKALLAALKSDGATIAGYGAAAKATTFLAYLKIERSLLDFIVDLSPDKVGLFMGGNHIPILPVAALREKRPDYLLILAWNFADEIIRQQSGYRAMGGKLIVPIPELRVILPEAAAV